MQILDTTSRWLSHRIGAIQSVDTQISDTEDENHTDDNCPDGGAWVDREPSNAIAHALADRKGIATEEVPPVFGSVDPDGLNAVVRSAPDVTVEFSHCGCEVTVTGRGEIEISGVAEE